MKIENLVIIREVNKYLNMGHSIGVAYIKAEQALNIKNARPAWLPWAQEHQNSKGRYPIMDFPTRRDRAKMEAM